LSEISSCPGGSVYITSKNPLDDPVIDPNLLGTELDRVTMREAFLATRRLVSLPAFKGYIIKELPDLPTDDAIDAYLKDTTAIVFHPVTTASMSPYGASWGVTDPDLRVKGVKGLRIVDASVFVSTRDRVRRVSLFIRRSLISPPDTPR
jgi:choline dehydrogenase-like flavoprotein